MANEKEVRTNFVSGTITDNPLTAGALSFNSAGLAALGTVDTTNFARIIIENEIMYVTAHTAAATSATVVRGQEGTTAVQHVTGTAWKAGPAKRSMSQGRVAFSKRASTDLTLNSTVWANVDTALDLALTAQAGDIVEVALSGTTGNAGSAFALLMDAVSLVAGAPVNSWAEDGTPDNTHNGIGGWRSDVASGVIQHVGGSIMKRVVAGDLSGSTLTLRLRYRTSSAANVTLFATTANPVHFSAKNHGPQES